MNVYRCFFGILCEIWAPQRSKSYCLITCCMKIHLLLFALNWPPASFTQCSLVLILEKKANNPPLLFSTHDCVFSLVWLFSVVYHYSILYNLGQLNPWISLASGWLHIFLYVCCSSLDCCHFCYTWASHVAAHPILFFVFYPAIFHQLWDSFWLLNQFFCELLQQFDLISEWEQVG